MCSDRWSDRENERWHRWQRNGFCPVCLRKWRVSSSDRANFQVQPSHVHWYGFSPAPIESPAEWKTKKQKNGKTKNVADDDGVDWNSWLLGQSNVNCAKMKIKGLPVCVRLWAFRCELFVYTFSQPSKSHLWTLRLRRLSVKSPREAAELGGGGGESPGEECRCGLSPLLVDVPCEGLAEEEDNGLWLNVLNEEKKNQWCTSNDDKRWIHEQGG